MMKKPIPLWVILIVLIAAASVIAGFVFVPNLLAPKPDFQLNASTKSETLLAHEDGSFDVEVTGLNNFTGILSASVNHPSGLSTFLSVPDAIPLYHTVTIHVQVLPLIVGNYSVTVAVVSGKISHSVSISYVVEGLLVTSAPRPLNIAYGSRGNETLTITGQNGFSGNLTIGASVPSLSPSGTARNSVFVAGVFPTTAQITRDGTMTATIVVDATTQDLCAYLCYSALSSDVSVPIGVLGIPGPYVQPTQTLRYPSASSSEPLARDAPLRALLSRLTLVKPTRLPLAHTGRINLHSTSQDDEIPCAGPAHRIPCEVYESFGPVVRLPMVLLGR